MPAAPDWANGMHHGFRRQVARLGNNCMPRLAFALLLAHNLTRGQQRRPGGTVDSAIHAAAAHQRRVGGVDDNVGIDAGDIALHYFNAP